MRIEVHETLARMLATERLHIRYNPKAKTASFDVDKRVLSLPMYARLMAVVYDLLAAHEVGHALWTTMTRTEAAKRIESDPKLMGRAAGYVNICEDARIETLIKEMYPGLRRVFRAGYQWLVENKFFGDLSDINKKSLIDRVNIYCKAGVDVHVPFAEKERPYVDAVRNARTIDEMFTACKAIYDFARETQDEQFPELEDKNQPSTPKPQKDSETEEDEPEEDDSEDLEESEQDGGDSEESEDDPKGEDDDSDGDGEESDAEGEDDDSDGGESEDGDGEDEGGEDSEESEDDTDGGGDEDSDDESDGEESEAGAGDDAEGEDDDSDGEESDLEATPEDDAPEQFGRSLDAETQNTLDSNLGKTVDDSAKVSYKTLPHVNLNAAVVDFKTVMMDLNRACGAIKSGYTPKQEWFLTYKQALEADVMYMAQQFLMRKRAAQISNTREATTGNLNPKMLWAHRTAENIFASTEITPDSKNHGLVLVVDWSSSMSGTLFAVMTQVLVLMMFCRRVNIPFEVYIFINQPSTDGPSFIPSPESVRFDGETRLYNIFSSRMSQMEFHQMGLMMFSCFKKSKKNHTDGYQFEPPLEYLKVKYLTPLGEALLIASAVVPPFKKRNRLQFVHTIFLTDGDGNGTNSEISILEDPITRRTYQPDGQSLSGMKNVADLMPRVLRDRTKDELIGFYVGSIERWTRRILPEESLKMITALSTEGYVVVDEPGYSAFFVLNPAMSVPENIDPAQSILMRLKSRVMLQRFIKIIA